VRGGDGMQYANEIRFDEWTLRRDSGEIARDGRAVRLRAQSQYVLETLLERPGEVVARERLIAELWPKGIVDFDTALNSIVRRLRSALEDDAGTPRYIETLPRRGYRYIGTPPERAPVATAAPAVPETTRAASPGRRWRVAAMAFVATLALAGGGLQMGFLERGALDELALTIVPELIGGGAPLFPPTGFAASPELVSARSYDRGVVHLRYRFG